MRFVVFGATGGVGQEVVRHALAAGLNATVARPTGLTNDPFDPNYAEAFSSMPKSMRSIPRSSVAHFLVKALGQPEVYGNTSVGLALEKC